MLIYIQKKPSLSSYQTFNEAVTHDSRWTHYKLTLTNENYITMMCVCAFAHMSWGIPESISRSCVCEFFVEQMIEHVIEKGAQEYLT